MPVGVAWIRPLAPASAAAASLPPLTRPAPYSAFRLVGQRGGARRVAVDDDEPLRAQAQHRMRDGRAGAAGAEQHHARQVGVGQRAPEAPGPARAVGVVADQLAVAVDHRVDRAHRPRFVGQVVEQRDHRLLARDR